MLMYGTCLIVGRARLQRPVPHPRRVARPERHFRSLLHFPASRGILQAEWIAMRCRDSVPCTKAVVERQGRDWRRYWCRRAGHCRAGCLYALCQEEQSYRSARVQVCLMLCFQE